MKELIIKSRTSMLKIPIEDIIYLRTQSDKPHTVILVTEDGEFDMRGSSLSELEQALQVGFYRCHKCYLVNLSKIQQIESSTRQVFFTSPQIQPIKFSRRKQHEIIQAWI